MAVPCFKKQQNNSQRSSCSSAAASPGTLPNKLPSNLVNAQGFGALRESARSLRTFFSPVRSKKLFIKRLLCSHIPKLSPASASHRTWGVAPRPRPLGRAGLARTPVGPAPLSGPRRRSARRRPREAEGEAEAAERSAGGVSLLPPPVPGLRGSSRQEPPSRPPCLSPAAVPHRTAGASRPAPLPRPQPSAASIGTAEAGYAAHIEPSWPQGSVAGLWSSFCPPGLPGLLCCSLTGPEVKINYIHCTTIIYPPGYLLVKDHKKLKHWTPLCFSWRSLADLSPVHSSLEAPTAARREGSECRRRAVLVCSHHGENHLFHLERGLDPHALPPHLGSVPSCRVSMSSEGMNLLR
ncbi:uncharacterized protein LOC135187763 [Pogoniulus pusillus]|uniref:uncharacterized protein LOC135187763 n=1 Tax=Pogoniulus pusillus TaxID=488313 RepID=UPI0030B95EC2